MRRLLPHACLLVALMALTATLPAAAHAAAPTCLTPISVSLEEDTSLVNVAGPCSDGDGDAITIRTQSGPTYGTFRDEGGGRVTYIPAQDFAGVDTIVAVANDGTQDSNPVTFNITVTPVDDAPRCVATRSVVAVTGTPAPIALGCQEVDAGDTINYTPGSVAPAHGSVTFDAASGSATYTSAADFAGADSFSVLATGSGGLGRLVTVQVTVERPARVEAKVDAANVAPTCFAATFVAASETSTVLQLSCSDPEGGALTYVVPPVTARGVLSTDAATGRVTYRPTRGFVGTDAFEFTARDSAVGTAVPVRVTIDVRFGCSPIAQGFVGSVLGDVARGCGGADSMRGGAGNDRLYGGPGADRLFGDSGNDVLAGDGGADKIAGGSGDDAITGGLGNDIIDGGAGRDRIAAGAGNDVVNVRDRGIDIVDCGLGVDAVIADANDIVRNCEFRR